MNLNSKYTKLMVKITSLNDLNMIMLVTSTTASLNYCDGPSRISIKVNVFKFVLHKLG